MKKDKLAVVEDGYVFRIVWVLAPDGDTGGTLGEEDVELNNNPPSDRNDFECWVASKTVREVGAARDWRGFYFESRSKAAAALRTVRFAMKQDRPLPEWAKIAISQGWKPPKGWSP